MARKTKGGVDFKKGKDPRRNMKGPPKIPKVIKELRKINNPELLLRINKYLHMTTKDLLKASKDKTITMFDHMIIKIIEQAVSKGSMSHITTLLDRTCGKVTDKVEHSGETNIHAYVMSRIKELEK